MASILSNVGRTLKDIDWNIFFIYFLQIQMITKIILNQAVKFYYNSNFLFALTSSWKASDTETQTNIMDTQIDYKLFLW